MTTASHGCLLDALHEAPRVVVEFDLDDQTAAILRAMLERGDFGSEQAAIEAVLENELRAVHREELRRSRMKRCRQHAEYAFWFAAISIGASRS